MGKHSCFCSVYLSHTLPLLLWLREATCVDFADVAGLGQSNHRCPSEVDQWASDIALAFQQPDWSVGVWHRKCKGVFPRGGCLNLFRRTYLRTPVSCWWVNLNFWSVNQRFYFVEWLVLGLSLWCNCLCFLIEWLDFFGYHFKLTVRYISQSNFGLQHWLQIITIYKKIDTIWQE